MSFHSLMNTTVDVKTVARTRDVYGTWTETETNRYADMPCRIQPISGKEQAYYNSKRTRVSHRLFCEGTYIGITEQDVVVDTDSIRYDVKLVRNIDKMGHHFEIDMQQFKPEV